MDLAGPKVTRAAVNDAIRKIDILDANGLVSPASPRRKLPPTCFIVLIVKGGKYQRPDPANGYRCETGVAASRADATGPGTTTEMAVPGPRRDYRFGCGVTRR